MLLILTDNPVSVVISYDKTLVVTGSADKSVKVFDVATKKVLHHFENLHTGDIVYASLSNTPFLIDTIKSVVISRDNRLIITGSFDKSINVIDLWQKEPTHLFADAHTGII